MNIYKSLIKNNKIILLLIIIFILFILSYIHQLFMKEDFALNNPNYCKSLDGTFIYITNPNDSRCAKNQSFSNSSFHPSGKGNCITKDNSFGLFFNKLCIPFQKLFPGLYNENKKVDDDSSGLSDSNKELSQEEKEALKKKEKKLTCENAPKLPNSTPCYEFFDLTKNQDKLEFFNILKNQNKFEFFESSQLPKECSEERKNEFQTHITENNINIDDDCQTYNDNNYGFFYLQCPTSPNERATSACRKYYKSDNNNPTINGTYKPEEYMYVPKKTNSDGTEVINQTGCFPKDLDFNNICQSVNNNQLYGAFKVLVGRDGNCYKDDGTEDIYKANAFCSTNFYNQMPKYSFPPSLQSSVDTKTGYNTAKPIYNTFMTKCKESTTDFIAECQSVLDQSSFSTSVLNVDAYDCPPNQKRAKCKYDLIQ